jgi:hypothetical protein
MHPGRTSLSEEIVMSEQVPIVGSIVRYRLREDDGARISAARLDDQSRKGNVAHGGDIVPLIVVRVWPGGHVNGQAILDGNDSLWVTSAGEGTEPGQWAWPALV